MNFGFSQSTAVMSTHPTNVMMQASMSNNANQNDNNGITMELQEDELWKKFHEQVTINFCIAFQNNNILTKR